MLLNILLVFGVGLPIVLAILDVLILWRPCGLSKSLGECVLSCLCFFCLKKKGKKADDVQKEDVK